MKRHFTHALLLSALLLIAEGCSSGAAVPPGGSPGPSASPALPVATADGAAALVIASDQRFNGVVKQDPALIGACCTYQAAPSTGGTFAVTIEIGWGDCPAGCINRHHWFYVVAPDGTVALQREDGPPVPAGVGASGGSGGGSGVLPGGPGIAGQAVAGPTCPVVRPGDSNCNDRPVAGATILVRDAGGTVVAQLKTDGNGRFQVVLPPGSYRIEPQPVTGLRGTARPIDVTVGSVFETVNVAYDTGIR
jgi:hypothetical protein